MAILVLPRHPTSTAASHCHFTHHSGGPLSITPKCKSCTFTLLVLYFLFCQMHEQPPCCLSSRRNSAFKCPWSPILLPTPWYAGCSTHSEPKAHSVSGITVTVSFLPIHMLFFFGCGLWASLSEPLLPTMRTVSLGASQAFPYEPPHRHCQPLPANVPSGHTPPWCMAMVRTMVKKRN